LVAEFQTFLGVLDRTHLIHVETAGQVLASFARFLAAQGLQVGAIDGCDEPSEVVYGNSGLVLPESGTVIHDYRDYDIPKHEIVRSSSTCPEASREFLDSIDDAKRNGVFISSLAWPAKN